jgi:hypothetical protein
LKQSQWINIQKQHYENCAGQTAQLLIRFGELRIGKHDGPGYTEEQMEVLANCPEKSGYSRKRGTPVKGIPTIYKNAGMITHTHPQTPENIAAAVKANYPVSTAHRTFDLWGESSGGHAVATVGYLKDPKTNQATAFLVHDTGRNCLYYVPAGRYKKSLMKNANLVIVIGKKTNCKDLDGNPVTPGQCCLNEYAKRKAKLAGALSETAQTPANNLGKWEEYYKKQAREARDRFDTHKVDYEFGVQMKQLAEVTGDQKSAEDWNRYCERAKTQMQADRQAWKTAKQDLLAMQRTITPMGQNDPGADADRKTCADADEDVLCDEVRQVCPICGE